MIYGIFLIATGNYKSYLDNIIPNIKQKFLTNHKKIIFITTDNISYIQKFNNLIDKNFLMITNSQPCRGFPADTMYRFEYFLNFRNINFNFGNIQNIMDVDYLIFMNINLNIINEIKELLINNKNLFFVEHPGLVHSTKDNMFKTSIENRNSISCFININNIPFDNQIYICGGFNGGKPKHYLKMCEVLKDNTIKDDLNNSIAKWHDESQINWYRLRLDKDEYYILPYLYCCPLNYDSNSYIDILSKDHVKIRNNNNYQFIEFTDDINTDLYRFLYNKEITNKDIKISAINSNYNSSRQGLLKNFFRIDTLSHGFKKNKIKGNMDKNFELILDSNTIKNFIDFLHIDITDRIKDFQTKYKNHLIVHINNNFNCYRFSIFDFIKKYKGKILVISHDKSYIDDKIWDNLENIEFYNFNNDEDRLVSLSLIKNHLFYDIKHIFNIINIGKYKSNTEFNLKYFTKNKDDSNEINFLEENFNLEKIDCNLKPGFSFIIRAKNEKLNVKYCLRSLEPILKLFEESEIIFVDNNSTDNTFILANEILSKYNNTKVLKYNVNIPKCGEEHKRIVSENKALSLGTYYKWCYSFASRYNVIKWDCDFLCNLPILVEMINKYKLQTISDDISVWFSGKQIFIKDDIYLDANSYYLYNEPRIQSKLNGFEYEDSRDLFWETPYTEYLIKNEKNNKSYHFGFPTSYYLVRDIECNKKVRQLNFDKKYNIYTYFDELYKSNNKEQIIEEINKNEKLHTIVLQYLKQDEKPVFYEMKDINIIFNKIKNNEIKLVDKRDQKIVDLITKIKNNNFDKNIVKDPYLKSKIALLNKNNIKVCILVLSCDKYKERIERLKSKLLNKINYKYFLIYCDKNIEKKWLTNNHKLFVQCEECYENLPKKVLLAYDYIYNQTDYDYIIKIDDDTLINEETLDIFIKNHFYNLDYLGALAGGHVQKDWHFGKCKNEELNRKLYWNEYNGDWCGGGFGYILSRPALSILLKKENYEYIWNEIYEDKSIGDILRKEGIYPCFEYLPKLKISKKIGMKDDNYIFISSH